VRVYVAETTDDRLLPLNWYKRLVVEGVTTSSAENATASSPNYVHHVVTPPYAVR
jgi:hypothetical protein